VQWGEDGDVVVEFSVAGINQNDRTINGMKTNKMTVPAILALGGLMAFGTMARGQATNSAPPPAEKKIETPPANAEAKTGTATPKAEAAASPAAVDLAKLEAEVGLTEDQKTQVAVLLRQTHEMRRAVRNDTSLTDEEKKAKMRTIVPEINGKIKALMSEEQYAKWQTLQAARRAAKGN
jgi:periplasmic protein CpxP/Spy